MKVYFITSNHNDLKLVKEFFSYYIDNFEKFECEFSDKIVINSCNVILEEFSNNEYANNIIDIKKKFPNTIFFLLFSEHITKDLLLGFSFNYFKKMNFFEKLIYLADLNGKLNTNDKLINKLINKINNKLIEKKLIDFDDIQFNVYMKKRYLGFEKVKEVFDCIFALDEKDKIEISEYLGKKFYKKIIIILPKSDKIKNNQNFGISISGAVTKYRLNILKKIENPFKIENNFDDFRNNTSLFLKKIHTTYNLHIPKNKYWKFHSLLKYILAIKNNEIPIISRKIEGKIGNLLCICIEEMSVLNKKNTYENILDNFNKKIDKYNFYHEKYKKEFKNFCNINNY